VARFPFPPHGRIPNFAGAEVAAARLLDIEPWKSATAIKVNPDSWQRLVLISDLVVLWLMWSAIRDRKGRGQDAPKRFGENAIGVVSAGLASIAVLGFSFLVATVPGGKDAPEAPLGRWWVPRWIPTRQVEVGSAESACSPNRGMFAVGFVPIPLSCLLVPTTWITKIVMTR
jgi:hypothetical protein